MEQELVTLAIGEDVHDPYAGVYRVEELLGKERSEAAYLVRDKYFKQHLFVFLARSPGHSPVTHRTGPSPGSPSPTVTHLSSIYPTLATSYAGTAVDLLNSEKTAMYLSGVQQNQNGLSGEFQGLGLTGPFTGTLSRSGHVQFIVNVKSNQEILSFDGEIKIGGDIAGSFVVQNQQGEKTGESGVWNIAAVQ